MTRRFPGSVYDRGSEPDPRFSLANERTFLAWIRTSLALIGAGVALEALEVPVDQPFRLASSALFVALGMMGILQAWIGWVRCERALREQRQLPGPSMGPVLTLGLGIVVALLLAGYLR